MGKMNRVTISVPHGTDLNFRKKAAIKFSFKRGWYGRAVQEAMQLWITVQTITEEDISEEKKNYLWNTFKEYVNIETNDPKEILDCIVNFFTSEPKFVDEIQYDINDKEVVIRKKGSKAGLISKLITKKNDCIIFHCPIKIIMEAALQELTGDNYVIKSEAYTMISPQTIKNVVEPAKAARTF